MPRDRLHEPWRSFLQGVDSSLSGPTEIHCLGGFVMAEYYGLTRPTADIDIVEARGASDLAALQQLAGKGSALAQKHGIYIDIVTVADYPEDYQQRLIDVYSREFTNLRVRVFERHDLVLAKLVRNQDHDREDVRRLAQRPGLDVRILAERYQRELRFQLGNPAREDLTLELWLAIIKEVAARNPVRLRR